MYNRALHALFISVAFSSSVYAVDFPSSSDAMQVPTNDSEYDANYVSRGDDSYSAVDKTLDAASVRASNNNAIGATFDLNRVDSITNSDGKQTDVKGLSLDSSTASGVYTNGMITVENGNGIQERGHGDVTVTADMKRLNAAHNITGVAGVDANYQAHASISLSADNDITREAEFSTLNDDGTVQEVYQVSKANSGGYLATASNGDVYKIAHKEGAFQLQAYEQPSSTVTNGGEHGAHYANDKLIDVALTSVSKVASNYNDSGAKYDLNRVDSVTNNDGKQTEVKGLSLDSLSASGVYSSRMITVEGGNGIQQRGHGDVTITRDVTQLNTTHDVTGVASVDASYEAHRVITISSDNTISRKTEVTTLNDDGTAQETYQVSKISHDNYLVTNANGEVFRVINEGGEVQLQPYIDANKYTRNELQTATYMLNRIDSNVSSRVDDLSNDIDTGAWVELNYTSGKQGGSTQHADTNSGGVTIGYDAMVNENLILGNAFTYSDSSSDYDTQPDSRSDNYSFTVYAYNKLVKDLFLEANGTYAYSNYDMDNVQNGNPGGDSFNTRLALGNSFNLNKNGSLIVKGVYNFSRATMDSYYLDDLKYDANDLEKSELGLSAHYEDVFTLSNKAKLIPSVSASYMYNFLDNENYTRLSGRGLVVEEELYGENNSNRFNTEVGLSYVAGGLKSKLSWHHLINGDYKDDSANINLSYSFK